MPLFVNRQRPATNCKTEKLIGIYRPISLRSRPAAVEGQGSGHPLTASSTSSKKEVLLWMVVPPNTTRTPGELALTWATILASS